MQYLIKTTINALPGVFVWRYGHLRIDILELSGEGFFILPSRMSLLELKTNGLSYGRILAKDTNNQHLTSCHIFNVQNAMVGYRKCILALSEHNQEVLGDSVLAVISRRDHITNNPEVWWSVEKYLEGYPTLEKALAEVEAVSLQLIRNVHLKRDEKFIKDVDYFGKLMSKFYHIHGSDKFLADHLGLSTVSVASGRSVGLVSKRTKSRLRKLDTLT